MRPVAISKNEEVDDLVSDYHNGSYVHGASLCTDHVYEEYGAYALTHQFSEGVKRSLYAVSTMLEQDETKHYLEEDIAQIEASSIYSRTATERRRISRV